MRGKKFLLLFTFAFLLIFTQGNIASAEKFWKLDKVDSMHDFTVEFNNEVDSSTLHQLFVLDSKDRKVEVNVISSSDSKKAIIEAPSSGYKHGETYYIHIPSQVKASNGKNLKEAVVAEFSIEENPQTFPEIEEALLQRKPAISIDYLGDTSHLTERIEQAINSALFENEYLNYDFKGYSLSWRGTPESATISFEFSYYQSAEQLEFVNTRVQEILDLIIIENMNDHEKVKAVHDYLVLNIKYDTTYSQSVNAPYFALTEGVTLCNGYAMLMYQMLKELNIPVRLISGSADGENHAWNLVQLDGKWFHLDATWDDPIPDIEGRVLYDYYLLSDDMIDDDHNWQDGGLNGHEKPYPVANTNYAEVLIKLGYENLKDSLGL